MAAVFILNLHNKDQFLSEALSGTGKFAALKKHTYRVRHLSGLGLTGQHLMSCSQFARQTRVTRIIRPNTGFHLDKLIDLIETELKALQIPVVCAA